MFRFEHPEFLWTAILSVTLLCAGYLRAYLNGKDWLRWGTASSNSRMANLLHIRPRWRWAGLVASILMVIAVTNPQWGFKTVSVENTTADIYLVLDISNSMLAEDVPPSRLERAKRLLLELSTAFRSDRLGLIFFAGNAYIQSPLTTDWRAIQLFIHAAHPDQAGTQGTAIGEAIRLVLQQQPDAQPQSGGALVLITDGEDHDSDATETIRIAASRGWTTYVIGVGTETGGTIPIAIDGRKDMKRDDSGQPVLTALNRNLMKDLASNGGGRYFDLTSETAIVGELRQALSGMERKRMEKRSFSEHKSYYQWFLLPALVLLVGWAAFNSKHDVI